MGSNGGGLRAWARRVGLGVAAVAWLTACGGGTVVEFKPNRVLAFGDELSYLEPDGRKFGINAFRITDATTNPPTESATELDCTRNPVWIQRVASGFGLAFDRCLGTATTASGQVLSQPGAKAADFAAQIAAVQGAPLNDRDLALVMIGMHDILELYGRYPAEPPAALLDEARNRAQAYGERINALARRGPAVVVLTVPDLGLTPFALAQNASTADPGRSRLLTQLTEAYNNRMSVTLINDGRLIGLVYADIESQNIARFPSSYGLGNVRDAACLDSAALPGCTSRTLSAGATSSSHMWADATRPGPPVQSRLGLLAEARAKNNPF